MLHLNIVEWEFQAWNKLVGKGLQGMLATTERM